ncbi:MAG: hypothetical protein A2017_17135 [Lentisphaerae bacterium GWF2_44_16]|nr:MAG: hypothetical protein A2017_17135 [Lentisphaerae bacterium GWF2_44_16]
MIKHKKLWTAFTIILLSGLIVGFFAGYLSRDLIRHHFHGRRGGPENFRKFFVEDISARLKLSEAQQLSLRKNADGVFPIIDARHTESREQTVKMIDNCIMSITPALDEDQLKSFNVLREEGKKMFNSKKGKGPPPPPNGGF